MNDLKTRIKASLVKPSELHSDHETALYVLADCLVEIERLEGENLDFARCVEIQNNLRKDQSIIIERLRKSYDLLIEATATYPAHIKALEAELAKAKEYVPMTDDEFNQIMQDWYNDNTEHTELTKYIEAAVIKRYNEQRNVK